MLFKPRNMNGLIKGIMRIRVYDSQLKKVLIQTVDNRVKLYYFDRQTKRILNTVDTYANEIPESFWDGDESDQQYIFYDRGCVLWIDTNKDIAKIYYKNRAGNLLFSSFNLILYDKANFVFLDTIPAKVMYEVWEDYLKYGENSFKAYVFFKRFINKFMGEEMNDGKRHHYVLI